MSANQTETEVDSFAVRFARAYLESPSPQALASFLAEGAHLAGTKASGLEVAQAEVASEQELGDGHELVTVACELRDARTLYLAVPIAHPGVGEVAALGAPSIVAAPVAAGVKISRPQPLSGTEAPAIESLVAKFIPTYVSSSEAADLSYLLAPGAAVAPLAGTVELLGTPQAVQLGSGEGAKREVIALVRARDPLSGANFPLAYRLELVRRGRWYVQAVKGAMP